jgi:hypothetical protein
MTTAIGQQPATGTHKPWVHRSTTRDLVKLSLLLCPDNGRVGKGHESTHYSSDERGWR